MFGNVPKFVMAMMDGGNFFQGFVSGALGSIAASGWTGAFGSGTGGMIAFGALAGGVGAELSGGNFFKGFLQGGIVAGLNHAMNHIGSPLGDEGDPRNPNNKRRITRKQAKSNFLKGKSETMYQDVESMGITLQQNDFKSGIAIVDFDSLLGFNNADNAFVVGKLAFERIPGNPDYAQVAFNENLGCRCELYDFNMEGNPLTSRGLTGVRNALTAIGSLYNSTYKNGLMITGVPFKIQYNNIIKISK